MGKRCVVVNDSAGFVSNRVLMLSIAEAIRLVEEGVATAEQTDLIFRACLGHKMGPLETADLIGLDNVLDTLGVLEESLGARYHPPAALERMVEEGRLGRKSGGGFHDYPEAT